jgi:Fe2+ transport system protein FeoA
MATLVEELVPLHFAPSGATVRVAQLVGAPEEIRRLRELGLGEGTVVEIVQSGSPCIIRLAGHKLCFRQGEGFHVLVNVGAGQ